MKPSTTFSTTANFALLIVGEPKSGKSGLLMSFPDLGIIDWDLNLASAVRRDPTKKFVYTQPSVLDDGKERSYPDQWNYAIKETQALIADPTIKNIAVDGLGLMTLALCAHITNEAQKAGASKVKTMDLFGKVIPQMELQHYNDLQRLLRAYVMMVRSSGKNLIVTSHQTAEKDTATGLLRYSLAIPGSSKDTLGGCFTDVWAMAAESFGLDTKYKIRTKPTGMHVALGASFPIDSSIDVTNKSPSQIWQVLEPKINAR